MFYKLIIIPQATLVWVINTFGFVSFTLGITSFLGMNKYWFFFSYLVFLNIIFVLRQEKTTSEKCQKKWRAK